MEGVCESLAASSGAGTRICRPSSILNSQVYSPVLRYIGRLQSTVHRRENVTECDVMVQPFPPFSNTCEGQPPGGS